MIVGHKRSWQQEATWLSPILAEGLAYLANTDLAVLSPGRYEVGDKGMFVMVSEYETAEKTSKRPEVHQKYIDIQWLVAGEEIIGCSQYSPDYQTVEEDFAGRDIAFFATVKKEVEVLLEQDGFAIFFPWDVHRPGCQASQVKKVKKAVLKIPVALGK